MKEFFTAPEDEFLPWPWGLPEIYVDLYEQWRSGVSDIEPVMPDDLSQQDEEFINERVKFLDQKYGPSNLSETGQES